MQQQRRADADHGAIDGFGSPPSAWVRPTTVAGSLGVAFAIGIVPTGIAMIAAEPQQVGLGIVLWAILSVGVAVPLGLLIALVGWRAERVLVDRGSAGLARWVPWGVGIAVAAHWAPLCLWTHLLVLQGVALRPWSADEYLGQAVLSLVAWVAVGGGVGLVLVNHRLAHQHGQRGVRPVRAPAYRPSRIPTSVPLAAAAALIALLPSGLWVMWLEDAWSRGTGMLGLLAWGMASAGGAVLAGWLTGVVCIGGTGLHSALGAGVRARQLEVVGAVVTGVWTAAFLVVLAQKLPDDLRFSVIFTALGVVTLGVAMWSVGRTVRQAPKTPAPVSRTPPAG